MADEQEPKLIDFQEEKAARRTGQATRQQLNEATDRIRELEEQLNLAKSLQKQTKFQPITHVTGTRGSEACAVAVATDWHIGAQVASNQVNGLNRYNIAIAKQRTVDLFRRIVKLTNKERQDVDIHHLLLLLNGDLIDGSLHLDTIMSGEVSQVFKQAVIAQECIEAGLQYLKEQGNFKQITICCSDGNHGRVTERLHHGSRKGNSAEWYLYYTLAQRYPEFNWVLDESILTYVPVFNWVVRCLHGDPIHFGGVNGPHTYLKRRIYQWDTARRADVTVLGHLHQYLPTRKYVISGSLVGYSPYSLSLGAEYEPPIQAFFLLDKKRGVTVQIPILF